MAPWEVITCSGLSVTKMVSDRLHLGCMLTDR
jgi:hypothetical protein